MVYPLWAVTDGDRIKVIRGSTQELAMGQAARTWPVVGRTLRALPALDTNWGERYSAHHNPGWLYREPSYEVYVKFMERAPRQVDVSTT